MLLAADVGLPGVALGIEHDEYGNRAKAYLYCLETRCPETGWMVPLSPSWVISKTRNVVAKLIPDHANKRFDIIVVSGVSARWLAITLSALLIVQSSSLPGVGALAAAAAGSETPTIVSDWFDGGELDEDVWRWVDPLGGSSLSFSGSHAEIAVPDGELGDGGGERRRVSRLARSRSRVRHRSDGSEGSRIRRGPGAGYVPSDPLGHHTRGSERSRGAGG
jgi:hypothetical protein